MKFGRTARRVGNGDDNSPRADQLSPITPGFVKSTAWRSVAGIEQSRTEVGGSGSSLTASLVRARALHLLRNVDQGKPLGIHPG